MLRTLNDKQTHILRTYMVPCSITGTYTYINIGIDTYSYARLDWTMDFDKRGDRQYTKKASPSSFACCCYYSHTRFVKLYLYFMYSRINYFYFMRFLRDVFFFLQIFYRVLIDLMPLKYIRYGHNITTCISYYILCGGFISYAN